ncbi:MAG: type III-A CRISPR-associated RAMP protein Csm3 [Chitinophagales bacterium]|nr:type III-A CRISPR-associated RAMP protein Csm3 [Chitinophagales bacterium]
MKLIKKQKLTGTITLLSGLHIGDSKESADIGGVDSPIVRRKDSNQPYIPGSSIKGKIRCLLEQLEGATEVGKGGAEINQLFGITEIKKDGAIIRKAELSRLIVRDCYMTKESVKKFNDSNLDTDLPFSEIKFENTIDRVKGAARQGGLRNIERIPAGAEFDFEFILNYYEGDSDNLRKLLDKGISALNADYLGGSGTRGYGHIEMKIVNDEPIEL